MIGVTRRCLLVEQTGERRFALERLRDQARAEVQKVSIYNFPVPFWIYFNISSVQDVVVVTVHARAEGRSYEVSFHVYEGTLDTVRIRAKEALTKMALGLIFHEEGR